MMHSFFSFLIEETQTDKDAQAFHSAIKKHLQDRSNFKTMLQNRDNRDGIDHFSIPVSKLDIPPDVKKRYSGIHSVSMGSPGTGKTKQAGAFYQGVRSPERRLFGLLPGKRGNSLHIGEMPHLHGKAASNPELHDYLHTQTLKSLDSSYPTFRHEFEHAKQVEVDKKKLTPPEKGGYFNADHEVEARNAVLAHHLRTAYAAHPENFHHIQPIKTAYTAEKILSALSRTGRQIGDKEMTAAGAYGNYNRLTSENKAKVHDVVYQHIDDNHSQWSNGFDEHKRAANKRIEDFKRSNGPMLRSAWASSYSASGIEGFKPKIKSPNKHTPEGVLYEPHVAKDLVGIFHNKAFGKFKTFKDDDGEYQNYVKGSNDEKKRAAFYSAHKLKLPRESWNYKDKTAPRINDYEDNPHIVAHYLNTMQRHFPHVAKHFGLHPLNYDTNKAAHDKEEQLLKMSKEERRAYYSNKFQ